MSSTNKTDNLQLNQWLGTDSPQRIDFCSDNLKIDEAFTSHINDTVAHITADERKAWNNSMFITSYAGNNSASRNIKLSVGFTPRFGIVFPTTHLLGATDFSNETHYNYFGFFSTMGSTIGLSINDTTLSVAQSATLVAGSELRSYNETGVTYIVVCFR